MIVGWSVGPYERLREKTRGPSVNETPSAAYLHENEVSRS